MYQFYNLEGTRSVAAHMVLEEAGVPYRLHRIDISSREHRTPEFLRINPRGLIPALVSDTGEVVCETAAIMLYVADRHRLCELAPLPGEPGRGALLDWIIYLAGDLQDPAKRLAYTHRYSADPGHAPGIREQALKTMRERWHIVDDHLEKSGPYHLGERFSLADIYMLVTAAWFRGDRSLEELPAVKRCYDLVAARPKIAPIQAEHERWLDALNRGAIDLPE